ncbi:MAG: hypothetical protein Kow006_10030 [Gammaproteobacteria bacterium]
MPKPSLLRTALVTLNLLLITACGGGGGGPSIVSTVTVSWTANVEAAVNSAGGGYRVYYSTTPGFDIATANFVDVPYTAGPAAPTSTDLQLATGTHYIKVTAYSALNPSGSASSAQITVVTP